MKTRPTGGKHIPLDDAPGVTIQVRADFQANFVS